VADWEKRLSLEATDVLLAAKSGNNSPESSRPEVSAASTGPDSDVSDSPFTHPLVSVSVPYLGTLGGAKNRSRADIGAYHKYISLLEYSLAQLKNLNDFIEQDIVTDEGLAHVVEIETTLEELSMCDFGAGTALENCVVAVQGQVCNCNWTKCHVGFLDDAIRYLRARYTFVDSDVDAIFALMKRYGLDQFRGAVSGSAIKKTYVISEVPDEGESADDEE
jgi:hypothetical protein